MVNLHSETALIRSFPIEERLGHNQEVYLKMECYQPTGSYKIRGIGARCCEILRKDAQARFVSSSGGNAGLAVAYSGRILNVAVDVFIPTTSSSVFKKAIEAEGATVHIVGDVWDETNKLALEFGAKNNAYYIHPFDHPTIWKGHATMIDECNDRMLKPDAVLVAVGGGGLACGVLQGMQDVGWKKTAVYTVETEGAASCKASLEAGHLVSLDRIETVATSLGAKQITSQLLDWSQKHSITPYTVTDSAAVQATKIFFKDHRVKVEASSGAVLAALLDQPSELSEASRILVIICGGIGEI